MRNRRYGLRLKGILVSNIITVAATGTYSLTIRATDGGGLYDDAILDINIDDFNDNFPVFTPGTPLLNKSTRNETSPVDTLMVNNISCTILLVFVQPSTE